MVGIPAARRLDSFSRSQANPGFQPQLRPLCWHPQFGVGMRFAAGDESGKPGTAGRLTHGVISQIETPPNALAFVWQRRMHQFLVKEEHVSGLHGKRTMVW